MFNLMRWRAWVSLLLLGALCSLAACGAKTQEYQNKEKGFSIQFPKGWEVKKGNMKSDVAEVTVSAVGKEGGSYQQINVSVENLAQEMGLEEYYQKGKGELSKMFPQFQALEEGKTTLNNQPAQWLVYSFKMKDTPPLKMIVYTLVKGKQGYNITAGTVADQFDRYRKQFEEIAKTFRLE